MGEGVQVLQKDNQSLEKQKEILLKAWTDANLLFPQTFIGIHIFLADAAINKIGVPIEEFGNSDFWGQMLTLSEEEIKFIRKKMERVHDKRGVVVGIEDDQLRALVRRGTGAKMRLYATEFIAYYTGKHVFFDEEMTEAIKHDKAEIEEAFSEFLRVAKDAFTSEHMKSVLRKYQKTLAAAGRDSARNLLHEAKDALIEYIRSEYPEKYFLRLGESQIRSLLFM